MWGRRQTDFKEAGGWRRVEVRVHGFESLPSVAGEFICSPRFLCFGHQWKLLVYLGGYLEGDGEVGIALKHLKHASNDGIDVMFSFSIKDSLGREVSSWIAPSWNSFGHPYCWSSRSDHLANCSDVVNALVDGSMIVGV